MMSAACKQRQFTERGILQCKRPALFGRQWCARHQAQVELGREGSVTVCIQESLLTKQDMAWCKNGDE